MWLRVKGVYKGKQVLYRVIGRLHSVVDESEGGDVLNAPLREVEGGLVNFPLH